MSPTPPAPDSTDIVPLGDETRITEIVSQSILGLWQ